MNITDFDIYGDLLKKESGLVLSQDKSYLIESRLNPVAKKWGYENIGNMTNALRAVPPKELIADIVEAMTTNETSFFRDARPFDIFKDTILPYYMKKPSANKHLRIWCAAAASGQEPYSLAMLLKEEAAKMPGWRFTITATDISNEILEQAKGGVYSQFEVQRGLPIMFLMKYFTQNGDKWTINDEIKKMVNYKYFNLLKDMSVLGKFDVVFCRNVLIYFDQPMKKDIMERISKQMADDGFFFLGGAETILGITEDFKSVSNVRGLYAKHDSHHVEQVQVAVAAN
ncbi:MAG: protein-glutamate O-methyltransferase CheR [Alphaproteobacteria bacterium]|nr:protein-glutamate O-methyltransferase CheR [Alphaproteobacteria bacterium]